MKNVKIMYNMSQKKVKTFYYYFKTLDVILGKADILKDTDQGKYRVTLENLRKLGIDCSNQEQILFHLMYVSSLLNNPRWYLQYH